MADRWTDDDMQKYAQWLAYAGVAVAVLIALFVKGHMFGI
jgi:hypothetical protein